MQPEISVIVPVYNAEKWVRRCVDSIAGQEFQALEIVCVNDCSTDTSLAILRDRAREDARIVIVDLPENRGEGGARNAGMAAARGAYTGFVDSDDTVDAGFFGTLYAEAKRSGADMVEGPFRRVDGHGVKRVLPHWRWFSSSLFRTGFLKNHALAFPARFSCGDDVVFMARVFARDPRRSRAEGAYYNYHVIPASASQRSTDGQCASLLAAYQLAFSELEQRVAEGVMAPAQAREIFLPFFQALLTHITQKFTDPLKEKAAQWLLGLYAAPPAFLDMSALLLPAEPALLELVQKGDLPAVVAHFKGGKKRLADSLRQALRKEGGQG